MFGFDLFQFIIALAILFCGYKVGTKMVYYRMSKHPRAFLVVCEAFLEEQELRNQRSDD